MRLSLRQRTARFFTADNDADGRAFVEELADEVAEELNQEEPTEEAQESTCGGKARRRKSLRRGLFLAKAEGRSG